MNKGTFKKGHKMSPEIREKISKKLKGIKRSPKTIAKMKIAQKNVIKTSKQIEKQRISITGRKASKSTRLKMSLAQRGEKSNAWKGGITSLYLKIRHNFKIRQWRDDCFTRDDFTCQKCNIRGGKLTCHHIKYFSKIISDNNIRTLEEALDCDELWNINNGITLCNKCHINKHKKDGYKSKKT